ncbi:hypothetical protein RHMOL_Rhmol12G0046300 [Rhododendron molle]|uniref:Uncharacterized protein n=1 Tax=Rhododendron molle TaxID=49168 RepID=A0ACC0LE89_RHOML|nr:hypothetical protein RHMOL_Rhmol12G0046300 [Rhododendron molle]
MNNAKLEMLGSRMSYAHDLSKQRTTVNDRCSRHKALKRLPITAEHRVKVGMTITRDARKIDYFFSLEEMVPNLCP